MLRATADRSFRRGVIAGLWSALFGLLPGPAAAGLDDCLKAALNTASPKDMERTAAFAINHPSCLQNLVPPTLVPYIALSGALDAANKSGALKKVGLEFGDSYQLCVAKIDPGKAAVKQLAPVLKPVCGALKMNCKVFEGPAADEVNSKLASEVPLLSLLPCACAAATSGLGVEKIAELVATSKQCGATLAEVGKVLGKAASGAYKAGGAVLDTGADVAGEGLKLVENLAGALKSFGCAVGAGYIFGGCQSGTAKAATKFCAAHGGVAGYGKDLNWVTCNDKTACATSPGKPIQCFTAAQYNAAMAAGDKMKKEQDETVAFNMTWCRNQRLVLDGKYRSRCHDKVCELVVVPVLDKYEAACAKETVIRGPTWAQLFQKPYLDQLEVYIKESVLRDPKADPHQVLAYYDCRPFLGRDDESLCGGTWGFKVCRKLVDDKRLKRCKTPQDNQEYPLPDARAAKVAAGAVKGLTGGAAPGLSVPLAVGPTVLPVNGSRTGSAPATPAGAPAVARSASPASAPVAPAPGDDLLKLMSAAGCKPILRRAGVRLCRDQEGFYLCKRAVDRRLVKQCDFSANGQTYPPNR